MHYIMLQRIVTHRNMLQQAKAASNDDVDGLGVCLLKKSSSMSVVFE